jgi:hypothetical protein
MAPIYTNAENQARHRAKLIEQMGIDAFRAKENKRILDAKNRKRAIPIQPKQEQAHEPVEEIKPIKKRVIPILKSKLSDASIIRYSTFIKGFFKCYRHKDLNENNDIILAINSKPFKYKNIKSDFAFLNDKNTFIDVINKYKSQIGYLYSIVSRVYGMTSIVKKLYPYLKANQKKYENDRAERVIPDDVINTVSFDVNQIIEKVENAKLNRIEKIMAYLALLLPTKRFNEYRLVKISQTKPNDKFDKKFNYYYNGTIYIYNTKNKVYNEIDIPDEVFKLIDNNDEYLMGELFKQATFSAKLANITFKIYGMSINNTLMRRLYSTYLRSLNLNGNDYEKEAHKMGHSLSQNLKYSYVKPK